MQWYVLHSIMIVNEMLRKPYCELVLSPVFHVFLHDYVSNEIAIVVDAVPDL